jgi:hypothetical protein
MKFKTRIRRDIESIDAEMVLMLASDWAPKIKSAVISGLEAQRSKLLVHLMVHQRADDVEAYLDSNRN